MNKQFVPLLAAMISLLSIPSVTAAQQTDTAMKTPQKVAPVHCTNNGQREDGVDVYATADTNALVVARIACGVPVIVLSDDHTYSQVQTDYHSQNGLVGYMSDTSLSTRPADVKKAERTVAQATKAPPQSRAEKVAAKLCAKNPSWTTADCLNVAQSHVLVGMTYEMVLQAWGRPRDSNTTQLPDGHYSLQLVYNNPNGGLAGIFNNLSCGLPNSSPATCTQYKNTYVYVQDGYVTAIQN